MHRDCPIVIQGAQFKAFDKRISNASSGPSIEIQRPRYTRTVHGGPFHRNPRSFRSDGYAQMPYKKTFFRFVKYLSWKSRKLICIDTSPLESLDSSFFYSHFRIHEGQELEIWLSRLREIDACISTSRSSCFRRLRGLIASI